MSAPNLPTVKTIYPPPTDPRHLEMFILVGKHSEAEFAFDLDRIMSTMTSDVWWEFGPLGIRAEGPDAVRQWYRLTLPVIMPAIVSVEKRTVACGTDHIVFDHYIRVRMPDGSFHEGSSISMFYFRGDKIIGERVYCDLIWTELYRRALGPDVTQFPGISFLRQS